MTRQALLPSSAGLLFSLLVFGAASGCKSSDDEGGNVDGAVAGDTGNVSPGGTLATLGFKPSNLPLATGPTNSIGDVALTGECVLDGEKGTIKGAGGDITTGFSYALVEQTDDDRTKVATFFVRNLRVETAAQVSVVGPYPVAVVAWNTVRVNGGGPGGAAAGPGSNGGKTYGNETISPLLGGSSGGSNDFGEGSGGGGALQIIAGSSIDVGTTGALSVAGGGGTTLGGGGAGSGGAILLEAPSVRVAGIIAANGGGGGGTSLSDSGIGENGRADAVAAKGGAVDNHGGDGSAAAMIDGGAGTYKSPASGGAPNTGGAGGGGAGRIRINTAGGSADVTGTLSPSIGSCATIGKTAT